MQNKVNVTYTELPGRPTPYVPRGGLYKYMSTSSGWEVGRVHAGHFISEQVFSYLPYITNRSDIKLLISRIARAYAAHLNRQENNFIELYKIYSTFVIKNYELGLVRGFDRGTH